MSSIDEILDSDDSDEEAVEIPGLETNTAEPETAQSASSPPQSVLSYRFRESPKTSPSPVRAPAARSSIAVLVSAPARPWEYEPFRGHDTVDCVLGEADSPDDRQWFRIEYEDGRGEEVPLDKLLNLRNGQNALDFYENGEEEQPQVRAHSSTEPEMSTLRAKRSRSKPKTFGGFVDSTVNIPIDSGDDSSGQSIIKKRRLMKGRVSAITNGSRQTSRAGSRTSTRPSRAIQDDSSDSEEPLVRPIRSSARTQLDLAKKRGNQVIDDEDELAGDAPQDESGGSDIVYEDLDVKKPKRSMRLRRASPPARRGNRRRNRNRSESSSSSEPETRRSGRQRHVKSMREHDVDDEVYADDISTNSGPKIISIREVYQPVAKDSSFRLFHSNACDVCSGVGALLNKGPLIFCQGCSISIHKNCLGYRSGREHMVTKVGPENFVLQCRRCIGTATKKNPLAPRLDTCQGCRKPGKACSAFSPRKTNKQEEKLREENDGQDPITQVADHLLNNSKNVLFRCSNCDLAYHYEHLPAPSKSSKTPEDPNELRELRLKQYGDDRRCLQCRDAPAKVQTVIAWRVADRNSYEPGQTNEDFTEDEREYLIKWEDKSYFQCTWMSGAWVWGTTASIMRKAFFARDEGINRFPKWTNEEAVPEEFLRMEIIFDVSYKAGYKSKSEKLDKTAISYVGEVYVKFQGLGYEDAVWENPPEPEDEDRWSAFVAAYNEYIAGKYFKQMPSAMMKEHTQEFRELNFEDDVELKVQPKALTGGKMMPYQMEGLNWLLYNFHQKKNVILADEMGLGKTIQIISLLAALIKGNPKCWPFLIVTPNSTCPNWRREIKKWAPSLRVVAYYGGKKGREMAKKYELYPDGCTDLRAHVVVTSYEGPVDDHSKPFFRKVKWAGMIVDEGQRLKNDGNLLYVALQALKIPFQVLLTGTPLQNNKRELFNLLQFLDSSINAAKLDAKYEELTKENLPELHDLIRPYFLRRTKLQVLKFLPPMAQVILPVTMSVVQKKLYKSILARNPQLIRSIFGQKKETVGPKDRSNLNNILMQLRKCLCHPFIYSDAIEERSLNEVAMHRNLVDASSKFQLLEIMLPKLQERGHRVLIFSQFLDQLTLIEDFLTGLDLTFERLDGKIGALEKQKRIDAYNAPDSPLFAFLLSTRSGGVGINLATADTVIIMDPDFNPHQDIQALSRAHRIGQKKKVLCFQLMTKDSAEEKIVQIGRKKMALDQALIESLDAEDDAGVDLESILKFGAEALFNDDDTNDIRYDSASVDKLLDRTQVETTDTDEDKTAESQFSFARIWANDKGTLTDDIGDAEAEAPPPDFSVWEKILKQRESDAAAEAARNAQKFGRGQRSRGTINYEKQNADVDDMLDTPVKTRGKKGNSPSDLDFDFASGVESELEEESDVDANDLGSKDFQLPPGLDPKRAHELLRIQQAGSQAKTGQYKPIRPPVIKGLPSKVNDGQNPSKSEQNGHRALAHPSDFDSHFTTKPAQSGPTFRVQLPQRQNGPGSRPQVDLSQGSRVPPQSILPPPRNRPLPSQTAQQYPNQQPMNSFSNGSGPPPPTSYLPRNGQNGGRNQPPQARPQVDLSQGSRVPPQSILPPPRNRPLPSQTAQQYPNQQPMNTFPNGSRPPPPTSYLPRNGQNGGRNQPPQARPIVQSQPNPNRNLIQYCQACKNQHVVGQCQLRVKGLDYCGLCGLAHFGISSSCPHLGSDIQIRLILDALSRSPEPKAVVDAVGKKLRQELAIRAVRAYH